jgi:putative aminopeptidase FrvX
MKLLKMLAQAAGPSGNENSVREVIKREVAPLADEVYTDNLGSLIARIKGDGPKVMIDAHMDEVGVIATFIEDSGLVRFASLGGLMPNTALSQRVRFLNGVLGVVSKEQKENVKELKLADFFIDIGAKNKADAESRIKVGDAACFEGPFEEIGTRVVSKALDDRVGCYVLIETMKKIKESGGCKNDLYFVFSVTEELGLRGARAAAGSVLPDFAVAVDVTMTGDLPGKNKMAVQLGGGPAVKVKDNSILCHPYMKNFMVQTCEENNIPFQMEVLESGGTNAGAIHISNGGVVTGAVSIPARFIHTPCEMVDMGDINGAVTLLTKMAETGFSM